MTTRFSLLLSLAVATATATNGAVVRYEAFGEFIASDFPMEVTVGDRFFCMFSYDESIQDVSSTNNTASFSNALLTFALSLEAASGGSYGGGVAAAANPLSIVTAGNVHWVYMFLTSGFGVIAGEDVSATFYLLDYTHSTSMDTSGTGRSLADVIGGPLNLANFQNSRVTFSAGKSTATASITRLTVVPAPDSTVLVLLGSLMLTRRRRPIQEIQSPTSRA